MQRIRESRTFVVVATWIGLTLTTFGASGSLHPEDSLDICTLQVIEHDAADHRVTGRTGSDAPEAGHCDICHLLRSLRSAPALTRVGTMAPVGSSHALGIDTHARVDSRARYRLPSRSPPA